MRHLRAVLLLCAVFFAASCARNAEGPWVTSWATSLYEPGPLMGPVPGVGDRTIRNAVTPTTGGDVARITFSNRYGETPLFIGSASIGVLGAGPALLPDSVRRLTFSGQPSIMVAPGREIVSDAAPFAVHAGTPVAVSVYLPDEPTPVTGHITAWRTSWISEPGDHAAESDGSPFDQQDGAWRLVSAIDVSGGAATAIVAIGDSITEGYGTTPDTDHRWTDFLSLRLRGKAAVLNAGVNGNLLLRDSLCFGPSARSRWETDVTGRSGVAAVILTSGVNDFIQPEVPADADADVCLSRQRITAAEATAEYAALAGKAHAENLRILIGTLPPFGAFEFWSPSIESERQRINEWIRANTVFDGVVDFDAVLRDPGDPARLAAKFDSGDGLHPNDAGAEAMANAVDLSVLAPGRE